MSRSSCYIINKHYCITTDRIAQWLKALALVHRRGLSHTAVDFFLFLYFFQIVITESAHFIWVVNIKMPFFTSEQPKRYKLWSCQKMCDALHYLLDNIFIRVGSKLYRQIVGIQMGTNCAPRGADLFLFCYERDFMLSLSDNNQTDIIEAFNSTSRYLDDLLNIDNPYFEQIVGQIYPTELQLDKANSSNTEATFLDLNLSITNGIVSSKFYDKRDDCNFEIVNFPFLDGDVPRSPSYGGYIS